MDYLETLRAAGVEPKGLTIPVFFVETVENAFKSKAEGRPIYDEMEYVKYLIPGDRNTAPVERVSDEVKARYPKEYEAFKAGLEAPVDGTPLSEWPPIRKSQVQEFAYFNIKTVEHLARINDAQLQNLGMGARELREQAKAYLDIAANGTGPISQMLGEIDSLKAENARKDDIIAEFRSRLAALEKGK